MKWAREQDPPDEEPSKPACTTAVQKQSPVFAVKSLLSESRENPRERERKIQGQEKRERQRKLKMRRGIRDDASFTLQGVRARLRTHGSGSCESATLD
jgi:hypothetical protein